MKVSMVAGLLGGIGGAARGQTWDEWWHQKRTRLKYLRRQAAELMALEQVVKHGYQTAKAGILHIGDVRSIEYAAHFRFFRSLQEIDPAIGQLSVLSYCMALEGSCLDEIRVSIPLFTNSRYLSPEEKTVFIGEVTQISQSVESDVMPMIELLKPDRSKMMDGDRIELLSAYVESLKMRSWKVFSMLSRWRSVVESRERIYEETDHLKELLQ